MQVVTLRFWDRDLIQLKLIPRQFELFSEDNYYSWGCSAWVHSLDPHEGSSRECQGAFPVGVLTYNTFCFECNCAPHALQHWQLPKNVLLCALQSGGNRSWGLWTGRWIGTTLRFFSQKVKLLFVFRIHMHFNNSLCRHPRFWCSWRALTDGLHSETRTDMLQEVGIIRTGLYRCSQVFHSTACAIAYSSYSMLYGRKLTHEVEESVLKQAEQVKSGRCRRCVCLWHLVTLPLMFSHFLCARETTRTLIHFCT